MHDEKTGEATEQPSTAVWKEIVAKYQQSSTWRALWQVTNTFVPFIALWFLMYFALQISWWLVMPLAILAAGFLVRIFIIFHDCGHGSFFKSQRANNIMGFISGVLTFTPYFHWRWEHSIHHATSGDLDRRGTGDVTTWTVDEYRARSRGGRIGYRLFRNPAVMFGLGPIWGLMIQPRRTGKSDRPRLKNSVHLTNLALALLIGTLVLTVGWQAWVLVQFPPMFLAAAAGVWLFYVQHQFEDAYWENADSWSYEDAALQGSSHLALPQPLQWFSGNIGLHHVHHLSARVPNYNLQRAHDNVEVFHGVPTLTLWDGIKTARLKLWDEESRRLITWPELRRMSAAQPTARAGAALAGETS